MNYTKETLGDRLKIARLHRGYEKQADLVSQIGLSKQEYSLYELGVRKPAPELLTKIAGILKIKREYFETSGVRIQEYESPD